MNCSLCTNLSVMEVAKTYHKFLFFETTCFDLVITLKIIYSMEIIMGVTQIVLKAIHCEVVYSI